MQRYFVNQENITEELVTITGEDVFHISKVLRGRAGDKIICCNGTGLDCLAEITEIEASKVTARILHFLEDNREPQIQLVLAQALPKSDKMELIIQKGTEIGVSAFLPFTSERTIVQLNDKKEQKRGERWRKIAKEAAEQSHRSIIPELLPTVSFKELLRLVNQQLSLFAYENERTSTLYKALENQKNPTKILLIIGPEGGFTEKEAADIQASGAISVSLGKRILRTETAGLVGAANILYELEVRGKM